MTKKKKMENESAAKKTEEKKINVDNVSESNESEVNNCSESEKILELQKEVDSLKSEKEELNDKYIRKIAEFENYRKNMLKQQADLIKNGGERVLIDILPLIDDFERALSAMKNTADMDAVKEGVELIYNKFISFMNTHGVKSIETENAVFNTDYHEAVTLFPTDKEELKNKIIDCISKGYTMNEKVIRYAKVVVGQ